MPKNRTTSGSFQSPPPRLGRFFPFSLIEWGSKALFLGICVQLIIKSQKFWKVLEFFSYWHILRETILEGFIFFRNLKNELILTFLSLWIEKEWLVQNMMIYPWFLIISILSNRIFLAERTCPFGKLSELADWGVISFANYAHL